MRVISKWIKNGVLAGGFVLGLCATGLPFTQVIVSTAAPQGLEQQFIAATTTQYLATVSTNPFFANTFQIQLYGPNPNFNPLPTNEELLNDLVTVDSYTYVNGWADGESYQQSIDAGIADDFTAFCSSASYFGLVEIDSVTCNAVAGGLAATIFQMHLATPTVIPGDFQ